MKMSKFMPFIALGMLLTACGDSNTSDASVDSQGISPNSTTGTSTNISTGVSTDTSTGTSTGTSTDTSSGIVEQNISTQALNSVKTSFEMKGGYILSDFDGADYVHPQNIVFAENEHYYDEYYQGKLVDKLHLTREDNVIYLLNVDKDNVLIKQDVEEIAPGFGWENVANPFIGLVESDFVKGSEAGVFTISNDKANPLANALGGYIEVTESVKLTVENDLVKRIEFTALSGDGISVYDFQVLNHGVATGPTLPYATTPEHAALKTALLALNGNYTIDHFDHSEGFEDISYTYYMTEDAVYKDASGLGEESEQTGFFAYKDDTYLFEVDNGNVVLGNISYFDLFAELPDFDFAPELFEYISPNLYQVHDPIIASMIGAMIGENYDAKMSASYAHRLTIELKDGDLYKIRFSYDIYGVLISDITMTFSDVGTTILPIDLSAAKQEIDDNQPVEGDLSHMYGTYTGNFNSSPLTVVISEDSITFNGEPTVFVEIDDNDDLVVTYDGKVYYLTYESSYEPVAIMITDGAKWGLLSKQSGGTTDPVVELPTAIEGDWDVDTGIETITISITGNTILFNGNATTVLSFDEFSGEIEFTCEGTIYYIIYIEDSVWGPEEFVLRSESYTKIGDGVRQGGGTTNPEVDVPDYMEGVWIINLTAGGTVRIEIIGNVVTFDGITATVTEFNPFFGLFIEVEGETYCIYHYVNYDYIDLFDENDSRIGMCTQKGEPFAIDSRFIGTFEGTMTGLGDFENYEIVIVITETSITINDIAAVEITFNEEWGIYEFNYNGDMFSLESSDGEVLWLTSADYSVYCNGATRVL